IRTVDAILAHFGRCNRRTPDLCARRSDQRPGEETSPQLQISAAPHRICKFGGKSLESSLTPKLVNDTISFVIDIQVIDNPAAAALAVEPMGSRPLPELAAPASAATLATRVGLARQKVNYHLHALEAHGLVRLAQERKWGGLTERLLVATAASYVVSP